MLEQSREYQQQIGILEAELHAARMASSSVPAASPGKSVQLATLSRERKELQGEQDTSCKDIEGLRAQLREANEKLKTSEDSSQTLLSEADRQLRKVEAELSELTYKVDTAHRVVDDLRIAHTEQLRTVHVEHDPPGTRGQT